MATVYRKTYTKPLPDGAELLTRKGVRYAKYSGRDGKMRTKRVTEKGDRLLLETGPWYARIRIADGGTQEVNTRCKDRTTAEQCAAALETEQDKIRVGVYTKQEANAAKHARESMVGHITRYCESMTARDKAAGTISDWRHYLETTVAALGWRNIGDIDRAALDAYLERERRNGRGARSCNAYGTAWTAFGNWLLRDGKTAVNPVAGLVRFDETRDRRRVRRALSVSELEALFTAAETRPLQERQTNRGSVAKLTAETVDALQWLGKTRALAYRIAAFTGLRWNELRSLTIGAAHLEANTPFLLLEAGSAKNRKSAQIPLQCDLRDRLVAYRAERIKRLADGCSTFPGTFDGESLLDGLPQQMTKVFNKDCAAAGIPKQDAAGRTVDVHALRTTFGTMLARNGVSLTTAQRLMRHSTPALTANVYTVVDLVDTGAAVNALPIIGGAATDKGACVGE